MRNAARLLAAFCVGAVAHWVVARLGGEDHPDALAARVVVSRPAAPGDWRRVTARIRVRRVIRPGGEAVEVSRHIEGDGGLWEVRVPAVGGGEWVFLGSEE
jgi:hypothetical protein